MAHNAPFAASEGLHLRDNFLSTDEVADNTIGQLDWQLTAIGNASTYAYLTGTNAVGLGGFRTTTANTADGDGTATHLNPDSLVLGPEVGRVLTRVRYPNITGNQLAGNNFRIGVDDSVTATSPTVGIWIDSDAGVISLQADSADHGDVSANAANVPTLTSGTTMVLGTWHSFEVRWGGTNAQGGPADAQLFIDGYLACQLNGTVAIDNDEEMEPKIAHWQDTGGAATLELDVHYYDLAIAAAR